MNTQPRQVDADPQTDIICHCKSITRADIVVAADAFGGDVGAICHATGAGRVCGGCVPRIGQIVGKDLMRDAVLVARTALDDHHTCYRFTIDAPIPRGSACRDALFEFTIGGRRHERSYTLTEIDAQARAVTITVRREANGIVSRWLSDKAKVGESVRISDPFGGFMAPSGHSPVFLAAGIGITPAVAWMRADTTPTRILWWVRGDTAPGLVEHVRALADETSNDLQIFDTSADAHRPAGEAALGVLRGLTGPDCDHPHLCGPQGFLDEMVTGLDRLGWGKAQRHVASFIYAPGQGADGPAADLHKLEQFDIGKEAVQAPSFHLRAADGLSTRLREARAFLRQFYHEVGAETPLEARLDQIAGDMRREGSYVQTEAELAYGARLAWRNSNRCIGRFFWQSLTVRDRREIGAGRDASINTPAAVAQQVFDALMDHIAFGTNGGDLRPSITVFAPDGGIFIENPQLILYAGYRQQDGSVVGDPKNVALTDRAHALGWQGDGTPFDALPLMIRVGDQGPYLFDIPREAILEVSLRHPDTDRFGALGLKWFAMPAVANMALDVGGVVYGAAPSNGFYMGTEIGSFNLADPRRYNRLPEIAAALGLDTSDDNPLWRDQAVVEVNRAVIHSFRADGVRILDHHDLSRWFDRFRADEDRMGRPVFGHWPWIVPPMSANLSNVWHDAKLKNVILKPGYFYQKGQDAGLAVAAE